MEKHGYERYGLTSNPFQDLASETLQEIELFHVEQGMDRSIDGIKEEVLEGHRKAVLALVGPLGVGKTERLKVAVSEADRFGAFCVYEQLTTGTKYIVEGLSKAIREEAPLSALAKHLSTPKWYRDLQRLEKQVKKGEYDPEEAGELIAAALNAHAPAFVLLNDLHSLQKHAEVDLFLQTMHAVANHIGPGVLIVFTAYPDYFAEMEKHHAAFTTRIDRVFRIDSLSDEEASLLVAKRLPAKRLVEDLDPLYPFTPDAVSEMNAAVSGNPRKLLKMADRVLELAVRTKAYHVDAELVQRVDPTDVPGSTPETPAIGEGTFVEGETGEVEEV